MLLSFFVSLLAGVHAKSDMNVWQRVACDICMQVVKDCTKYEPNPEIFSSTFPPPSKLGALMDCKPPERDLWTTDGRFKIEKETRKGCPGFTKDTEKRRPFFDGKKGFVRAKMCDRMVKKNMPKLGKEKQCTKWVREIKPNTQGGSPPDCAFMLDTDIVDEGDEETTGSVSESTPSADEEVAPKAKRGKMPIMQPTKPPSGTSTSSGGWEKGNVRQRFACDICKRQVKDCSNWTPPDSILDPELPKPVFLGRMAQCSPSERREWTEIGTFKIDPDYAGTVETREACPCYAKNNCRGQSVFEGKLDFARSKMCKIMISKGMPKSTAQCSKWVNEVVRPTQGLPDMEC